MSGYVLCVIGTVLLSAILTAILPEGKTAGVIKGITRLVCVLAIVSPVLQFLQSKDLASSKKTSGIFSENVIEVDESFIQYYSEKRVEETETALAEELATKYGVDVAVTIRWEYEREEYQDKYEWNGIRVTEISIKNKGGASEEIINEMAEYITKNYCSEVLIE